MISRSGLRLATVVIALVALIILLHLAAGLDLRGPTGLKRSAVDEWATDPTRMAATVMRWLALGLSYYLLAVVLIVGSAGDDEKRAKGWRRLIPARLGATVGALLGFGAVVVPFAHHVGSSPDLAPISSASRLELAEVEAPLRLTPFDDEPSRDEPAELPADPVAPALTWDVETGDHLWLIAEETLAESWGRQDLTDSEIATYWRTVIAANEHLLVEPGNPDLLLPGQTMILPAVPPG